MGTFKKYMLLKVKNGGLYLESIDFKTIPSDKRKVIDEIAKTESVGLTSIKVGDDLSNPVPYTNLSNMLTVLAGGIPVPTNPNKKHYTAFETMERPSVCDEMALNSYIHIESPVNPDGTFLKTVICEDGTRYGIVSKPNSLCGGEFFHSEKVKKNANKTCNISFMVDGKEVKVGGKYNYNMLLRLFGDDASNECYVRLFSFLNETLGVEDVRKTYTFKELYELLHEKHHDETFRNKVSVFYNEIKPMWDKYGGQNKWFYVLFLHGEFTTGSNTQNSDHSVSRTYLIETRGINKTRININGEIVVPITDESVYEALINGKGYCSFLDGGTCEIVGIENRPVFKEMGNRHVNYEQEWVKIH